MALDFLAKFIRFQCIGPPDIWSRKVLERENVFREIATFFDTVHWRLSNFYLNLYLMTTKILDLTQFQENQTAICDQFLF